LGTHGARLTFTVTSDLVLTPATPTDLTDINERQIKPKFQSAGALCDMFAKLK